MSELDIEEIFNTIIDYGCTIRKFVLLIEPKENIGLNALRMVKESFAYFKFLAIFLETIVYCVIVYKFLEVDSIKLIKQIFAPTIFPLIIIKKN